MNIREQQTLPLPNGVFCYTIEQRGLAANGLKPAYVQVVWLESAKSDTYHVPPQQVSAYMNKPQVTSLAKFFADLANTLRTPDGAPEPETPVEQDATPAKGPSRVKFELEVVRKFPFWAGDSELARLGNGDYRNPRVQDMWAGYCLAPT